MLKYAVSVFTIVSMVTDAFRSSNSYMPYVDIDDRRRLAKTSYIYIHLHQYTQPIQKFAQIKATSWHINHVPTAHGLFSNPNLR